MKLSPLTRLLSYVVPVRVRSFPGKTSPRLTVYRYRGRWQLEAQSALYSDGSAYTPLVRAFRRLRIEINQAGNMLVLGAGLGSAVSVLTRMRLPIPETTMVDIDPNIIDIARELLPHPQVAWRCEDVRDYVATTAKEYDLMILDVFQDRIVPQFVHSLPFLERCANLLSPDGTLVFNYIINEESQWKDLQQTIGGLFHIVEVIPIQINRVLILKKTAN